MDGHWCNLISFQSLALTVQSHIQQLFEIVKPVSYSVVSKDPNWVHAMDKELAALEVNHAWDILRTLSGCIKVKLKSDKSLERYKARLVAIGYNQ